MSAMMERAVERLRSLPENRQDELAPVVIMLADDESVPSELTAEDIRIIEESRAEASRGEFVSDEAMQKLWARFGV